MTTSDQIRFRIFHDEAGQNITDLDATVDHAGNLVKDNRLLWLLMSFKKELKRYGFNFKLWKEGEDE